jgi:hypothetical protein
MTGGYSSKNAKEKKRTMNNLLQELGGRGVGVLFGFVLGSLGTGLVAWLRRRQERRRIAEGDARDTVVIDLHVIETKEVDGQPRPVAMRVRALGQSEVCRVVPNGHLARVLLNRAFKVTPRSTLISMEGSQGSFLLETLTGFVCDRVANGTFEHDLYVMAPCCEPKELASHQPITILLVSLKDLPFFESWRTCRELLVEHGSDGARILTLLALAQRFRTEQQEIARLRQAGKRTLHVETSYILDLALDRRTVSLPTKPVPWGRFEGVLKQLNLE